MNQDADGRWNGPIRCLAHNGHVLDTNIPDAVIDEGIVIDDPEFVESNYDEPDESDKVSLSLPEAESSDLHSCGCCSIGNSAPSDSFNDELASQLEERNVQVVRLIDALGSIGDSGKRAVLEAIARRNGVENDEVDQMLEGSSARKLAVPPHLRGAMQSIGLGGLLAPVNVLTTWSPDAILVNEESNWQDIEFEVALDSGSVVHVCSVADVPGYKVGDSPGSRQGQMFLMGDGGEIPNQGQSRLNLSDTEVGHDIQSVFQIASVTRPLMSVGRICDEGHNITFDAVMAVVKSKEGDEICKFHRNSSGLYVAKLKLRSPAGFGGQE